MFSSRANSTGSLNEEPIYSREPRHDPLEDQIHGPEVAASIQFTKEHPIGAILLKLAKDNTALATKANLKGVATKIEDLCTSFHAAIQMEKDEINNRLNRTTEEIENSIILKDLNSHTLNSSVNPPTVFSPTPVITSPAKLTEVLKIFPRQVKFSGSKQDTNMAVTEYLNTLKAAQEQCKLSEQEFLDRMLAASTGLAHELILQWKTNGEDIPTIYHNLLVNFDTRVTAEDARSQLNRYRVEKSSTLAKAESHIMLLAGRVASALPEGPSRTAYYNLEAANALIRALPSSSSTVVNNLYNQISARLGRAATFAELSRALNLYRVGIDRDIKQAGSTYGDSERRNGVKSSSAMKRFSAYQISATGREDDDQPKEDSRHFRTMQVSFTPRPVKRIFNKENIRKPWFGKRTANKQTPSGNNNNNNNKYARNKGPSQQSGCSLCGKTNHQSKSCRNIVDNNGKKIDIIPTYGVCERCPSHVQPRLHHPSGLCPYRPGGPLNKK